ncbi:MAG: RNA-binding transcriptional accessory protein [Gammaproteobacteria bacterium]|uniref:Tex family protein n=1 Tax=Limnobacter sp. TaxID=2003368 RepID=UPI001DE5DFBD|nr:RNA-binding transcriptional accessory protein [Gammaproteobacteria bacterium]MBU0850665.1 RNA-binding transcriptional accessory protein [Gammaproteobacteria bacterium]MBU1266759.1 RNA-binding transcriptional accessory protein [Gammaproteobacteria bacterium]MBU1529149.1 RNA-binding transcriptional accessory protein [Gammaproteobacteria bacterium]MBU1780677.1 RNA-binding transcriptional accessory protein [Gammaproteobacteria bacterium]
MSLVQNRIIAQLAQELGAAQSQIKAAVDLLDEGSTVPFIARYRKEATGGLDDAVLRDLQERLVYLRELEDRRSSILESIESQGKLTPELKAAIEKAENKQTLEDLYLPYKPKRRTRAQIAREAGLQGLADEIYANKNAVPDEVAASYLNAEHQINDTKAALDGARDILAEQFSENAALLALLRNRLNTEGAIRAAVVPEKAAEAIKFQDYFEHQEPLSTTASHRMLAMLRGREQGFLTLKVDLPEVWEAESPRAPHPFESEIARLHGIAHEDSPRGKFLNETCRWTWKIKLASSLESEVIGTLRDAAQADAISVFGKNLKDLLLSAPAGGKATMGLDPGIRTGVKVAVIDSTGQVVEFATIYPHEPRRQWNESIATLAALCKKHNVELIAIGNGTASRETDQLAADLLAQHKDLKATRVMVSEAGASVYSASALASAELPDLDVSIRGAVSIARRLQDPLAELVKIDPKSIGVGQYQHDVDQRQLSGRLDAVVEDCVNAVGVEVNTASEQLLSRVSGLNASVAKALVTFRNTNGQFKSREDLRKVPRLGDKTFEQAAGFLRIHGAENPLDASSVHPEAYIVVEKMAAKVKKPVGSLVGNREALKELKPTEFVDERFGLPTVQDILVELEKPGRDPRPSFKTAKFDDKVHTMADLKPGMTLEGVVTNVANFGAFVDIGVHQDGLVHVSALSNTFVKDPHSVVKTGQIVKVKVLEVDIPRKRISLTMKMGDDVPKAAPGQNAGRQVQANRAGDSRNDRRGGGGAAASQGSGFANNAFAAAFAKAKGSK